MTSEKLLATLKLKAVRFVEYTFRYEMDVRKPDGSLITVSMDIPSRTWRFRHPNEDDFLLTSEMVTRLKQMGILR